MVSFGIPLFANIHLCGFRPDRSIFCDDGLPNFIWKTAVSWNHDLILCTAWRVCNRSTWGSRRNGDGFSWLITGVLGFDATGTALMLTIFALQDSFGTACNVTGDGALTMILTGYARRHNIEQQTETIEF